MLNLWLVSNALKSTYEYHNVNTCVCQVCNGAKQTHVQLMQLGYTKIFRFGSRKLRM